MRKTTKVSVKERLPEASLGWSCFGRYHKDKEFYTSKDKNVRNFIRKIIYGGRVRTLKKRFNSSHYDNITSVIMSHFNCQEKDAVSVHLEYIKNETKKK